MSVYTNDVTDSESSDDEDIEEKGTHGNKTSGNLSMS